MTEIKSLIADEEWFHRIGWRRIGNTFYPAEASLPKNYASPLPLLFWVRVDGTLRIAQWKSEPDISRRRVVEICNALGVAIADAP